MSNSLYNPFSPMRYIHPRSSGLMKFKGGGGAEPTTVDTIPDWYRPFIESAATSAKTLYESGGLSNVEGMNENQLGAISSLEGAAKQAGEQYDIGGAGQDVMRAQAEGTGAFSPQSTEALRTKAIRDAQGAFANTGAQLASSGQIGGARAGLLAGERDANLASALAGIDYQDLSDRRGLTTGAAQQIIGNTGAMQQAAGAGANYQGQAGQMLQEQSQRELDATYQGLQRLGSLLSGAPVPSQQQKSGGK